MKLTDLLKFLSKDQRIEISIMGKDLYEGSVDCFNDFIDLEIDEIYSYGDIESYDNVYSVICIDCKEAIKWLEQRKLQLRQLQKRLQ